MIYIKQGASTKYCNACDDGIATVDVSYFKEHSSHSSSFSLCSNCLSELAEVSGRAHAAQPAPVCACRKMNVPGVGEVVNATGCPVHGTTSR